MGLPRRRLRLAFLLALVVAPMPAILAAPSISAAFTGSEKKRLEQEARLVVDLLQNYHYSGRAFRDFDAKDMLDRFLDELDRDRDFLTQEDLALVHRRFDRTLKSVYLFRGDLLPAFEIFDLFAQRARARLSWVEQQLARDFDFSGDDVYTPTPPGGAPATPADLDRRWTGILRALVLREMLAGRDPAAARAEVLRQYQKTRRHIDGFDVLSVREHFFDALIRSYDPHSGYFSADSAREFSVGMQNAVGGIGVDLEKENGLCQVARIQPGGPADLTSPLRPGDVILALADGDAPWTEAATLRLRELVARVRGEPGSRLRLAYRSVGEETRREITLERTRVILTAERAHGAVSVVPDAAGRARRIGWITIPSFYGDPGEAIASSMAADVRELIEQMQRAGLDGLTLDLRTNPGGAMNEAVALGSLFLPSGNVVLSRLPGGQITEFPVKPAAPLYAGPLVVLTSAASASASEVFAGAMAFHRRALVVGAPATFGKGTMQNYIELAKTTNPPPAGSHDWGTLRLTAQHFFRPDGRAVQVNGVAADLVLPAPFTQGFKREGELPGALPPVDITPPQPATPAPLNLAVTPTLLTAAQAALARNLADLPEWSLWRQEQAQRAEYYALVPRSLNETKRREEWRQQLAQWADTRRERRTLTLRAAYPVEPFEIAAVAAAYDRHQAHLRTLANAAGGGTDAVRLHNDALLIPTEGDRLRRVWLAHLDVREFLGDVAELAEVYQRATGQPLTAAAMERVLLDFSLLEHPTQTDLLACFARQDVVTAPDRARLHRGVEACLARMVALSGEWTRPRPALDVPLREALRLSAVWAGQQ